MPRIYERSPKWWDWIRAICNKYLKINVIATSTLWNIFILFIVFLNTGVIIAYAFVTDADALDMMDNFDTIFNSIYIFDVVIKLIAIGPEEYFG
jgi:hypothetical protein